MYIILDLPKMVFFKKIGIFNVLKVLTYIEKKMINEKTYNTTTLFNFTSNF